MAQWYGTNAMQFHISGAICASIIVLYCFCLQMYSFADLISWTPPPTFIDIAITDRHSDTCTTIFQLIEYCMQMSCLMVGGRVVRWFWVNFQFRGVLLIWVIVGQGPIALAVGGGLDIFTLSILSLLFLPLSGRRPDID